MGASDSTPLLVAPTLNDAKEGNFIQYDEAKGPFWRHDVTQCRDIVVSEKGIASTEPITFGDLFKKLAKNKGDLEALKVERPCPPLGKDRRAPPALPLADWKTWTYTQYNNDSRVAARAMMAMGLEPFDGVNIFGFNSPEWLMSEVGAIFAGGVAAGIYPSDTPEQVIYKSSHSNSSIAVCETMKQANVFLKGKKDGQLPKLKGVIVWDSDNEFDTYEEESVKVCNWVNLDAVAEPVTEEALEERLAAQKPGNVCAYIYTSGTTGNPKAVMVTHDNLVYTATACMSHANGAGAQGQERLVSYLPLSHVAGMMIDVCAPLAIGSSKDGYVTTFFARPYDLKVASITDRLRIVKPTIFLGVPRVWEKIAEKMKSLGASVTGLKKMVATFSKEKGLVHAKAGQMGGTGRKPYFYGLANSVVLSKVATALGFQELKIALTGAAPIMTETLEYFGALGININECYGLSESTGGTTWSSNEAHVWGSSGWAIPGAEVKCFKPAEEGKDLVECARAKDLFNPTEEEQGELCFRGRHIMAGYMANASLGEDHVNEIAKKNASAIDAQGWLHSGDKGTIDERGLTRITGRYKELIVTAGGENVAPIPIEDHIKLVCPAIANVMMVGDKRKFNIAVVTLKAKGASGELPGTDKLDGPAKLFGKETIQSAGNSKKYIDHIIAAIQDTNNNFVPSNACKIQKFTILPADFSVQTGELTATLKLKRSVATAMHLKLIDSMYESKEIYVPFNDDMAIKEEDAAEEKKAEEPKAEATEEPVAEEPKAEAAEEPAAEAAEEPKA